MGLYSSLTGLIHSYKCLMHKAYVIIQLVSWNKKQQSHTVNNIRLMVPYCKQHNIDRFIL